MPSSSSSGPFYGTTPICLCCCDCYDGMGGVDKGLTDNPVRAFDGIPVVSVEGISGRGLNIPFGLEMAWGPAGGSGTVGAGWVLHDLARLQTAAYPGEITYVAGPNQIEVFVATETLDVWKGAYYVRSTLVFDSMTDLYTMTMPDGSQRVFDDEGYLTIIRSAGGVELGVAGGATVSDVTGTDFRYGFDWADGRISTVTQYVTRDTVESAVRRTKFTYWSGSPAKLQSVTNEDPPLPGDTEWQRCEKTFFTYHGDDLLKHVLRDASLRRMVSAGISMETPEEIAAITEEQYDTYADEKFTWDGTKVQTEATHGGQYLWEFAYGTSGYTDSDPNVWSNNTVVTRPDGSVETLFFNQAGSVLLRQVDKDGQKWWPVCQRFDDRMRVIEVISAAAISEVDPDPLDPEGLITFNADVGLIRGFSYDDDAGQVFEEWVQKGSEGDQVLLREKGYEPPRTVGSFPPIYMVTSEKVYLNATDFAETTFAYAWYTDQFQMLSRTTTLPEVPVDQNGTGDDEVTIVETFDAQGFPDVRTDQAGVVTDYDYDPVTGGMTQKIEDDGGLDLTTDYELDDEGRTILEKGPVHEIDLAGTPTTIRRAVWTYYRDPEQERITFPGYIIIGESDAELSSHCVGPVTIERGFVAPDLPDGTSFTDTIAAKWELERLPLPEEVYPQETWTRWQRRHYSQGGELIAERVYHVIPASGEGVKDTNYAETAYARDSAGRVDRVTTPGGTIQQTIFNTMGWVTSRLVGTAPGNMVTTVENEYDDNDDEGDGLLTKSTRPVDGSPGGDRVTTFTYDWRQRPETVSTVVDVSSGEATLITENTYDNRSLVTEVREYRTATGVIGNLLGQTFNFFDPLGRLYRTFRYKVDNAISSSPTDYLEDNTWYDPVGRVSVQWPAGSQAFQALTYDAVGRVTHAYTAYEPGWTSSSSSSGYGNAPNVDESIVMEQRDMEYDDAGNVTSTVLRQRYDDATETGPLGDHNSVPEARVSWLASYPDALGRTVATANYGTRGNTDDIWERPATVPAGTDDILVSLTAFNPAGEPYLTTDPMLAQTTRTWDAAGRLIEEIQGRVPGRDMPAMDRITRYTYNSDGNLTVLTALNNNGEEQKTQWVYGVTVAGGSALCSNLLVSQKIYPDSQGGTDLVTYTCNRAGQVTTMTDQAGLVHSYTYDQLGRQTADEVTHWGSSAADRTITKLTTLYNTRGLVVVANSYDEEDTARSTVQFFYNDWRQLATESQGHTGASARNILYGYASGTANTIRRTSMTYVSGQPSPPVLNYLYGSGGTDHGDALSRPSFLQDGSTSIVGYTWLGLSTAVDVNYITPATRMSLGNAGNHYSGLDRFGRPIDIQWIKSSTALVHARYGYDRSSNRQWRRDEAAHDSSPAVTTEDQWYEYDGLYQVRGFQRGDLVGTVTDHYSGITPVDQNQSWNYDAMGNWRGFTSDALSQTRQFNKVNEITGLTGPSGVITPQYDPTGNMTVMPSLGHPDLEPPVPEWTEAESLTWDAWNRLVKVTRGGETVAEYTYDALFRRITKTVGELTRRFYYNDQWQIIEEYLNSSSSPQVRYWYGIRDINDIARRQFFATPTSTDLYALRETMNVAALVNDEGTLQQRMAYDAFGTARFMEPDWDPATNTAAWPLLFHGHYQDTETGLYQMRFRYYHPKLGVWLSRDPMEETGGLNLQTFTANAPVNYLDPDGRFVPFLIRLAVGHYKFLGGMIAGGVVASKTQADIDTSSASTGEPEECTTNLRYDVDVPSLTQWIILQYQVGCKGGVKITKATETGFWNGFWLITAWSHSSIEVKKREWLNTCCEDCNGDWGMKQRVTLTVKWDIYNSTLGIKHHIGYQSGSADTTVDICCPNENAKYWCPKMQKFFRFDWLLKDSKNHSGISSLDYSSPPSSGRAFWGVNSSVMTTRGLGSMNSKSSNSNNPCDRSCNCSN